jgi:hypothetical protein
MALRMRVLAAPCGVLLVSAFLLGSCSSTSPLGTGDSPQSTTGSDTASTLSNTVVLSGTTPEHRLASGAALKLGDAVISYFQGTTDQASVDALAASTALESVDRMLASLGQPTASRVVVTADQGAGSGVTKVVLEFTDAKSQDTQFTLTIEIHADATTITAIDPGNTVE